MYTLFSVFETTERIDVDWFPTYFILRDQNFKEASLDKGFSQIGSRLQVNFWTEFRSRESS